MRRCEDCKILHNDDVRFCPNCGKSIKPSESVNADVRTLIVSSKAHLLHQHFNDALDDANKAMKVEPGNPAIASLLASIYEETGKLDEAAVWYRAALDIDPSNAMDLARLELVNQRISIRSGNSVSKPSDKRVKAVVSVCGALLLLVIALAIIFPISSRRGADKSDSSHINSAPPEIRINKDYNPQSDNRQQASTQTAPSDKSLSSQGLRTAGESAIRAGLAESQNIQAFGANINDVIADPRQSVATITFSLPASASLTKNTVILAAATIAQAAFAAHEEVKIVTARCVITPTGASTQIAFIGDVSRESINNLGASPNAEKLEALFVNSWWNPQIR